MSPLLTIDDLRLVLRARGAPDRMLVDRVSLDVMPGELFALVGESGSGKTMLARSILRLLPPSVMIGEGAVRLGGNDLTRLDDQGIRALRGRSIGMIFQEPMTSLNPTLTIGRQMIEGLQLHERLSASAARARALDMLVRLRIARPDTAFRSYPHQFSGGMRQRIMIATALAMRPQLLIADEPTTALDALIRREVMELMIELALEAGTAILLISHDLSMVAEHCQRLLVMRDGKAVESGTARDILLTPRNDYTRSLVEALPVRGAKEPEVNKGALVEIDALRVSFTRHRLFGPDVQVDAVRNTSLKIQRGETLAVVGESGSGKTTIARALLGLVTGSGAISFDGKQLDLAGGARSAEFRPRVGMVFQDPGSSLDPRMRLEDIVAEPLRARLPAPERRARAHAALEEVRLPHPRRFPHQLSGGQRQRVALARAIVGEPDLLIADEPVSALDPSVQHQVLTLFADLQRRHGFASLFVTHDLGVVEQVADRVAVMYHGRLLEVGSRDAIFDRPHHPYTRRLLQATPRIVPRTVGGYSLETVICEELAPPSGFDWYNHGSCGDRPLSSGEPRMVAVAPGHLVACSPSR